VLVNGTRHAASMSSRTIAPTPVMYPPATDLTTRGLTAPRTGYAA
jgi:hypothetical protein